MTGEQCVRSLAQFVWLVYPLDVTEPPLVARSTVGCYGVGGMVEVVVEDAEVG